MNVQQVTAVLTKIQALDNRQVDEVTISVWNETIGDLEYQDASAAVTKHFRDSTDYLQPAHVRKIASDIRTERTRRIEADLRRLAPSLEEFAAAGVDAHHGWHRTALDAALSGATVEQAAALANSRMRGDAAQLEALERHCGRASCKCSHTECTKGWLDSEGSRGVQKCPRCIGAIGAT